MCGIVGYIGNKDPVPILLKGLKRLEYRGYDSSGIALLQDEKLAHIKRAGKVSDLQSLVDDSSIKGNCGIAHTRWATHGAPNDINAHPHLDHTGSIALVHNGIFENYEVNIEIIEVEDENEIHEIFINCFSFINFVNKLCNSRKMGHGPSLRSWEFSLCKCN